MQVVLALGFGMFDPDQRLSRFLASAPDPTLIVDGSGSIVFASTQIEPVFGYTPGEVVGRSVEFLMPERFRGGHGRLFSAYFADPSPRPMGTGLELYARRKNGTEFPVEISLNQVNDGPKIYVRCAIRDATDRHTMEAKLRATAAEAETANAVKTRFLAAASHDLRQPLQAAMAYLSLLNRQAKTAEQEELCAKLRAPLQVMGGILDALLDISLLDSGSITPTRTDFPLDSVLQRITLDLRPLAEQKDLQFDYSGTDVVVNSDPALLERIVENLASNAIRYTAQGRVVIRVERGGEFARIVVVDTGIGIPQEAIGKIFDEYFQFDNPARDIKKGLGLGLAIVRRLAQLLDHPISVQSTLDQGSTFTVDVPLIAKATASQTVVSSQTADRPLEVLFIDDDVTVADSLSMVFSTFGIKAASAGDGDEAIVRVEEGFRPDVLMSDYRLPKENGLIVIDRVRSALGRQVPVIIMTGDTSLRHIEAQNIPKLTVIQKPVDPDVLVALIHKIAE
jgi:two-component system, sensor histidine kinase